MEAFLLAVKMIEGDLLNAAEVILGHQVNCQGVMGSGIARAIRAAYPHVYESYKEKCDLQADKRQLLGECQLIGTAGGKVIANLFGQYRYGRSNQVYTNYDALRRALVQLKQQAMLKEASVALPFNIGCGLANGDWAIVSRMIEEIFDDYDVTLYKI